jgi:hypothetical protein
MRSHSRRAAARALLARLVLASSLFFVANGASGQTTTSTLFVTVQVTNSCSFDSTVSDLLSVTCSIETPMVTSVVGAPVSLAGDTSTAGSPSSDKSKIKLCNALASSVLENGSFNQFAADVARKSELPSRYISTYQVCF